MGRMLANLVRCALPVLPVLPVLCACAGHVDRDREVDAAQGEDEDATIPTFNFALGLKPDELFIKTR